MVYFYIFDLFKQIWFNIGIRNAKVLPVPDLDWAIILC